VCLGFFRDSSTSSSSLPQGTGNTTSAERLVPCGVFPRVGFAAVVAPLCFLLDDPAALYSAAHSMYLRLWRPLDSLSDKPG
jgi:hypothetical protein